MSVNLYKLPKAMCAGFKPSFMRKLQKHACSSTEEAPEACSGLSELLHGLHEPSSSSNILPGHSCSAQHTLGAAITCVPARHDLSPILGSLGPQSLGPWVMPVPADCADCRVLRRDGSGARALLLTGANMAGKSTISRATCIAVILAQVASRNRDCLLKACHPGLDLTITSTG